MSKTNLTDDFLFELGVEELPTDAAQPLANQLKANFAKLLDDAKLNFKDIKTFAAPRRIAIIITKVDLNQPDVSVDKKGPMLKACYDADNQPTKALEGFLRSINLKDAKKCEALKTPKGEWIIYKGTNKGQKTQDLLPNICEQAVKRLNLPRSMRWHDGEYDFIRPVHWLVAILGSKIINLNLFGVKASNNTHGHRFHHPDKLKIVKPADYEKLLKTKGFVIACEKKRSDLIKSQVEKLLQNKDLEAKVSAKLLTEVTHLVSWPKALLCSFDEEFLKVPAVALISSMESHQKCFPIINSKTGQKNGKLENHFITISNINSKNSKSVIYGNEIVMHARLSDAAFFYKKDCKIALDTWEEKLKNISFHAGLGSISDKTKHVSNIADKIASKLKLESKDKENLKLAAKYSKCDLVSDMVQEFPSLQGIMGEIYASNQKYNKEISQAIREHYLPRFGDDVLPKSQTGKILALADKIYTICALFSIKQAPKGNKDPFALRRQAIGLMRILYEDKKDVFANLDLDSLISFGLDSLDNLDNSKDLKPDNLKNLIQEFLFDRFKRYIQDMLDKDGLDKSYYDAINATGELSLTRFKDKLNALCKFMSSQNQKDQSLIANLITVNKRIRRILKDDNKSDNKSNNNIKNLVKTIEPKYFEKQDKNNLEAQLFDKLKADIKKQDSLSYLEQLKLFSQYAPILHELFESVMIMAKDEKVKNNRLALLKAVRLLILGVADVSVLSV